MTDVICTECGTDLLVTSTGGDDLDTYCVACVTERVLHLECLLCGEIGHEAGDMGICTGCGTSWRLEVLSGSDEEIL